MNWTVVWFESAQNHLAELWLQALDREDVATAANTIDARLRRDPFQYSESRSGNNRVYVGTATEVGK